MEWKQKAAVVVLSIAFLGAGVGAAKGNTKFETQETVNLIIATPAGEAVDIGSAKFKELCETYSDGKITVDIFSNNMLGDDKIVVEGAQLGDIDIAVSSTSPVATMYEDYYLFDAAYMFLNIDEVYDVGFNGEAAQKIMEGTEEFGLKSMAWWENGFRVLGNNDIPVSKVEDVKGLKLRTMENPLHIAAWRALGANPTPMAFTEVFTALQQGTIDGQENSIGQIESNKLYEVQHYISLTNHIYTPYCVVMNLEKWESLTDEQKDIVSRSMEEATKVMLEESQKFETEAIKIMEDFGCEVIRLTDEQKQGFQDVVVGAGVYEQIRESMLHPEYLDLMQEELEKYREERQ